MKKESKQVRVTKETYEKVRELAYTKRKKMVDVFSEAVDQYD